MCLFSLHFFFNDPATTEIYTLSLHDALPIYPEVGICRNCAVWLSRRARSAAEGEQRTPTARLHRAVDAARRRRSEEHTSELQSQFHLVCRLLLEKKKNIKKKIVSTAFCMQTF